MVRRRATYGYPIPTRILPTDECDAPAQSSRQKLVEIELEALSRSFSKQSGIGRRDFLKSASGMAAAFMAMNSVFGPLFDVTPAEAADPGEAATRGESLSGQFIFDVQTHFVSGDYVWTGLLELRKLARSWNPALKGEKQTLDDIRYDNFVKEVFRESDTKVALLSSAPSDDPERWFITNEEAWRARERFNKSPEGKRLLSHAVFTPGQPGWLEQMDRSIEKYRPDSWKGYTVGAPSTRSKYPWRMDDEKLVYPAYEKMLKAGITNVCIHKGLVPANRKRMKGSTWRYGAVDDVGKAAKDWPDLNFHIYHSGIRTLSPPDEKDMERFEKEGRIPWVTDLAEIPEKYGVENVYAELGTVFGMTAISNPRYAAAILGSLIKGMGEDRVLWGTDSVWYGSPQWQIEAFRRLEIPEDLREKKGYAPLGPADGPVKSKILGLNAARLYGIDPGKYSSQRL